MKKTSTYLFFGLCFTLAISFNPSIASALTFENEYDDDGNLSSSTQTTGSSYVGEDEDGNSIHMDYGCSGDCDPNDPNISFRGGGSDDDDNGDGGGGGGGGPVLPSPNVTIQAQIKPDTEWYDWYPSSETLYIAPDDELVIRWFSSISSSCSSNFSNSTSTSHTEDVTPNLNPGESITYQVTCYGIGGRDSESMDVTVPGISVDSFIGNPWVVRNGETTELEWKLELSESLTATPDGDLLPYSYECEINGATPDGSPYVFNASDNDGEGSMTTRRLTSKFLNTLSCDTYVYEEAEVEVVPDVQEI